MDIDNNDDDFYAPEGPTVSTTAEIEETEESSGVFVPNPVDCQDSDW